MRLTLIKIFLVSILFLSNALLSQENNWANKLSKATELITTNGTESLKILNDLFKQFDSGIIETKYSYHNLYFYRGLANYHSNQINDAFNDMEEAGYLEYLKIRKIRNNFGYDSPEEINQKKFIGKIYYWRGITKLLSKKDNSYDEDYKIACDMFKNGGSYGNNDAKEAYDKYCN